MEKMTLYLLAQSTAGKTICSSEAARASAGDNRKDWEPLMDETRSTAKKLADEGKVVVTQKGKTIDIIQARGPVRIHLV